MYFSGGMIPYYLIIKQLGLRDTREVMYLPAYMSMFNMLVMRSYFMGLPQDLESAAIIDGAGEFPDFSQHRPAPFQSHSRHHFPLYRGGALE